MHRNLLIATDFGSEAEKSRGWRAPNWAEIRLCCGHRELAGRTGHPTVFWESSETFPPDLGLPSQEAGKSAALTDESPRPFLPSVRRYHASSLELRGRFVGRSRRRWNHFQPDRPAFANDDLRLCRGWCHGTGDCLLPRSPDRTASTATCHHNLRRPTAPPRSQSAGHVGIANLFLHSPQEASCRCDSSLWPSSAPAVW